jgi:hypothetical protein
VRARYSTAARAPRFAAYTATFGGAFPPGLRAPVEAAAPAAACGAVAPPAQPGAWLLAERGACPLFVKAMHAQEAGAGGLFIANGGDGADAAGAWRPHAGREAANVTIPVALLSATDAQALRGLRTMTLMPSVAARGDDWAVALEAEAGRGSGGGSGGGGGGDSAAAGARLRARVCASFEAPWFAELCRVLDDWALRAGGDSMVAGLGQAVAEAQAETALAVRPAALPAHLTASLPLLTGALPLPHLDPLVRGVSGLTCSYTSKQFTARLEGFDGVDAVPLTHQVQAMLREHACLEKFALFSARSLGRALAALRATTDGARWTRTAAALTARYRIDGGAAPALLAAFEALAAAWDEAGAHEDSDAVVGDTV